MSDITAERELSLTVRKGDRGFYEISLGNQDLTGVLPAVGGLKIEFLDDDLDFAGYPQPTVSLTFAPGALNVDLEADLVAMAEAQIRARAGTNRRKPGPRTTGGFPKAGGDE